MFAIDGFLTMAFSEARLELGRAAGAGERCQKRPLLADHRPSLAARRAHS